jgi:hypothetical protein
MWVGRPARGLATLLGVLAAGTGACQTDSQSPACALERQVAQPDDTLNRLHVARLDRAGDGFLLIAQDGPLVRWATVDLAGQQGVDHYATLPATIAAGPWFAGAGKTSATDTILIAYGTPAAAAGMIDIRVFAAASDSDGADAAAASETLATVPDPAGLDGASVAMGSGKMGRHAALAWSVPGQATVQVQSLDGDGHALGPLLVESIPSTTPLVDCLSFVAGRNDLSVGFTTKVSFDDPNPGWSILEVLDGGGLDTSSSVTLGTASPSCPLSAASGGGYVTVWQNEIGSFIGFFDGTSRDFSSKLFAGAVTFGGADVQPPLAGVGPVAGGDFAVVLARPGAAEAWRLDAAFEVAPAKVIFPSEVGNMGQIATVPLSGALYATYADYTSATSEASAQRFFIKITCF